MLLLNIQQKQATKEEVFLTIKNIFIMLCNKQGGFYAYTTTTTKKNSYFLTFNNTI